MKALLQPGYGTQDVLVLDEIDKPPVGADDVLVRMHAASLNFADKMTLLGKPKLFRPLVYGAGKPRNSVAGLAGAGVVKAVGSEVTDFSPGDAVFGELPRGGCCAEYALAKGGALAPKPDGVDFEDAAAVPIAGTTALQALRDAGELEAGQSVLINGASGGVGTFAVQIAKALGATVCAVCSTQNVDQARALGADEVIDYTEQDFTAGGPRFDVLLDLVGNRPLARCQAVLKPDGIYVASFGQGGGPWVGPLGRIGRVALAAVFKPKSVKVFSETSSVDDLLELAKLIESGLVTPAIERTYPLAMARDAFGYLLGGHVRGKLVITAGAGAPLEA